MEEKKTPRAKLHSGGHKSYKTRRGTAWTPHAPHPKPPTLTASQQKFAKKKDEDIRAYFKRLGLPPQKSRGESVQNYARRLGIIEDLGSSRNSTNYFNKLADAIARNYGDALDGKKAAPKMGLSGKAWVRAGGRGRAPSSKTAQSSYNRAVAAHNVVMKNIGTIKKASEAEALAKKQEAAQKVIRDKEVAARKAAAEAAKVKNAAAFKATQEAEDKAFAAAKNQAATFTPATPSFPVEPPSGGTMPKKTKDTSTGSAGGITESASQAGSVASITPEGTAPTELAYTAPDAVVSKVAPALVNTEGTYTAEEDITQLESPEDLTVRKVVAPTMDALEEQGAVTEVTAPEELEAASYNAETLDTQQAVTAAKGTVSDKAIAKADEATLTERAETAERDTAAEQAAMAETAEFDKSAESEVGEVTGEVAQVEETEEAETFRREAILGTPTPEGEAAEIMSMYDYNQSQQRAIQGIKAKDKAIKKLKSQGLKDDEIAKQLADNPELVADQMEDMPEDVRTTLSGLPQEALVDVQMESLLAGMEDGDIPAWAKPALSLVESKLAARGMSRSSVGRDALFNAVIQSAIPLAQSNAQAIQAATSQDKQIAADFLAKNAELKQQMDLANMSNDQQMRIANLSALNAASSDNLTAAQQTELANLNTRMQTNLTQAQIASQMNVAQLNVDQQRAVENAQTVARIDLAKFDAAQQVTLANSKFMQTMVQTEFNAEQQTMLQNATAMANMDMANADQRTKLAITNAQSFLQMDMTNLNNQQQANITKAQLNQQRLLSNQSQQNAAKQFNAKSETQSEQFMASLGSQIEQFNSSAQSAREQFNATENNKRSAQKAGNALEVERLNAQLMADINKFNAQQDFQRDQWNAANAQAIQQSNVAWRRQANLANTAAQNAANGQNVQIAYNMSSQEQTQLWQQMRDDAAYIRQAYENDEQRKSQLVATAISNEEVVKASGGDVGKLLTIANTALDKPKDSI